MICWTTDFYSDNKCLWSFQRRQKNAKSCISIKEICSNVNQYLINANNKFASHLIKY